MRLILVGCLLVPGLASAEPIPATDPAHAPGFVQIDRFDATSVAGGDVSYVALDGDDDVTVLRFNLSGRYVNPASRFGGYAQLPISYASGEGESFTGLGNLELGGLMLPKIGNGSNALVLRAGVTIPTGSDGEDAIANVVAAFARPQDIFLALPEAFSLRLGASPMFRSGNVFARIDVGLDLNLSIADAADEADPLVRINAGIGVDLGGAAIMGELSNIYVLSDDDQDFSESMINVFAISARFNAGTVMPYVSLLVPLDDDATNTIDLAFTGGLEARL